MNEAFAGLPVVAEESDPASFSLQCHGAPDKLAPGVTDVLKELYPQDQATGYAVGDLRGAVSVKIPIASGR